MKKYVELNRITDDISTCITSRKKLTQEQVFCFMKKFIADNGSFFDAIKTKSYKAMRSLLNELWQYREWEDMSSEQAFLYGQLYGCVKLCEYREQSHQDTVWINYLLSKYTDSKLFYIVKKNPGIRHKDLAKKIGLSTGRLSQMMDEEDMKELLLSWVQGREKLYFLSAKGEEFYQRLEAQKRKAKKAEMQKAKTENDNLFDNIFVEKAEESVNANVLSGINVSKSNGLLQYYIEGNRASYFEQYKEWAYLNFNDNLRKQTIMEEEKECLMEENSYYGQLNRRSVNGLMMSLAK